MSRRPPFGVLALAGGLALSSQAAPADWSFRPDAELRQTYTSNAQRTSTGSAADNITELRATFPVEARGRANRFEFAYAPTYEYFWDDASLNALNHLARLGWSREGERVRVVTLASYQRGEDPRVSSRPIGESPAPGAPPEATFLVERSETVLADLNALLSFKVGPSTRLETSAYATEQLFAEPTLLDTNEVGGAVGFVHERSTRQQWNGRVRSSRFSSEDLGAQSVGIVEGGGEFELHRGLRLTATLGGIVTASGGVLDELPAQDQILGEVSFAGQSRVVHWSAGVSRDVDAGGGLRLAVLNGAAVADLSVTLGPHDTLGFSASRSHSRQPVETRSTLDLTADQAALRVQHHFGTAWSGSIEAAHTRQESDDAGDEGTFEDNRVAIGVRWAGSSGGAR